MKLDNIEQVATLRNHRQRMLDLRAASPSGTIDLNLWFKGEKTDAFSVISAEPIRAAIFDACTVSIIDTEAELKALGVLVKNPEPPLEGTLEEWRRTAHMYCSAWSREMKGLFAPKRHKIDALVIGTRTLVEQKNPLIK